TLHALPEADRPDEMTMDHARARDAAAPARGRSLAPRGNAGESPHCAGEPVVLAHENVPGARVGHFAMVRRQPAPADSRTMAAAGDAMVWRHAGGHRHLPGHAPPRPRR